MDVYCQSQRDIKETTLSRSAPRSSCLRVELGLSYHVKRQKCELGNGTSPSCECVVYPVECGTLWIRAIVQYHITVEAFDFFDIVYACLCLW